MYLQWDWDPLHAWVRQEVETHKGKRNACVFFMVPAKLGKHDASNEVRSAVAQHVYVLRHAGAGTACRKTRSESS